MARPIRTILYFNFHIFCWCLLNSTVRNDFLNAESPRFPHKKRKRVAKGFPFPFSKSEGINTITLWRIILWMQNQFKWITWCKRWKRLVRDECTSHVVKLMRCSSSTMQTRVKSCCDKRQTAVGFNRAWCNGNFFFLKIPHNKTSWCDYVISLCQSTKLVVQKFLWAP